MVLRGMLAACLLLTVVGVVYTQPHAGTDKLLQSSWWEPDGGDWDQYVWDNFKFPTAQTVTAIRWRGGYDPTRFGRGGPVLDFSVAIYPSIAAQVEPDIVNPPLVRYRTGDNAGETAVGVFGTTTLYDYQFTLPRPFQAEAGVKYWVQIEAYQHGIPDWGLAAGTGGDGGYFRRIAGMGDAFYQRVSGDAAFSLLGPTPDAPQYPLFLPLIIRRFRSP